MKKKYGTIIVKTGAIENIIRNETVSNSDTELSSGGQR